MDVLLASSNLHKLEEFRRILAASGLDVHSPAQKGVPTLAVDEVGRTFAENAMIKARAYLEAYRIPVLADDSGIRVDALAGAPGVRSHRFGPEELDDEGRLWYMLDQLHTIEDPYRGAHYVCAAVLLLPDGRTAQAGGMLYGDVVREPQWGTTGFGYDPIFRPFGAEHTVAQMRPEAKDAISHRGRAMRKLLAEAIRMEVLSGTL
jgi:XTP/dITP diphosphohydrolase